MEKLLEIFLNKRRLRSASRTNSKGRRFTVISWNLLHRSGALVDDIAALIELERPDVFLMQEATPVVEDLPKLVGGQLYEQPWPGRRHGLATWSRTDLINFSPLELPASKMPGRLPTRFAQLLEINGITIANVHLSHGQILNRRQLRLIARSTGGPTAIIGDYNSLGPTNLRGFSDVGPRGSTHHAQDIIPFRLDRCMVRELDCIRSRTLKRGPSDHRPIRLDFVQPSSKLEPQLVGLSLANSCKK
ncbi:MAG: endonuclease/exonuclease/phosphatase family protein [Hyphomicrobiales bacterium]|nr:endonuclease/exonuclease/phosphatase family protein [Hyphomicrobiales bacterium]